MADLSLALTVWQPFAGLLVAGTKPVENRTWPPRGVRPGERLMIHAGARYEEGAWVWVYQLAEKLRTSGRWQVHRSPPWPLGGAKPNPDADPAGATPYKAIVGVVTLDEVRRSARGDDPWFEGPVGGYVRDPVPIEPVWCNGAQGLWRPSPAVVAGVRARVEAVLTAERTQAGDDRG